MRFIRCAICGCEIHAGGGDYAKDTRGGRSHVTEHHYVAKRFFGPSKDHGSRQREPIFKNDPWKLKKDSDKFCYECHEELLHNPVFLTKDISRFAELAKQRHLTESKKPERKARIAGRIKLLHEVIEKGLETMLRTEVAKSSGKT